MTFCMSSNDQNQCTKPMPHPPCPPCPAPPPPLGVSFALAKSLGDGMVLQRAPGTARVWGFAPAGTTVVITFKGKNLTATADSSKVWRQALPPQPASSVPTTITFASSDGGNASLRGVLFGDVHLCSGQSNSTQRCQPAILTAGLFLTDRCCGQWLTRPAPSFRTRDAS